MVDKFPLWNGENLDLDNRISRHPDVGQRDGSKKVFDATEDFFAGELPSWLSYSADGSVASPTFNADGSVTLETGSGSSGDTTALETSFSLNWADWKFVRFYVEGLTFSDSNNSVVNVFWANARADDDASEGFGFDLFDDTKAKAVTNNDNESEVRSPTDGSTTTQTLGFRVEDHPLGVGADFVPEFNGLEFDHFVEARNYWPAEGQYPFSVAVWTTDGTNQSVTFENMYLELIRDPE